LFFFFFFFFSSSSSPGVDFNVGEANMKLVLLKKLFNMGEKCSYELQEPP
jgi:hypothetical protein